jgi:hypothetical protein
MPTILYPPTSFEGWQGDPANSVPGSGEAVPGGVECVFKYNDFVFNDRSVVDKIRVKQIDGIDDADVRDSREDNPSREGETAHNALPGGRTLVFTGTIEAYELQKLRDMIMAFRTAFVDLVEKPLYFITAYDTTKTHYINCRKFSKLQIAEQQTHASAFFRDFQLTVRASDPRFYRAGLKIGTFSGYLGGDPLFAAGLETGDFSEFAGGDNVTGGTSDITNIVGGSGGDPEAYEGDRLAKAYIDGGAYNTYARAVHEPSPDTTDLYTIGDTIYWGGAFWFPAGFKAAMQNQVDILRADNFRPLGAADERFGLSIFNSDHKLRVLTGAIDGGTGSYDPATLYTPIAPFDFNEGEWLWIEVKSKLGDSQLTAVDASGHSRNGLYAGNFLQGVDSSLSGGKAAEGQDDLTSRITTSYAPLTGNVTVFGRYKRTATATKDDLWASDGATWTRVRIASGTGGDISMTTNAAVGSVTWTGGWPNDGLEHGWKVTFNNTTKIAEFWIETAGVWTSLGTKTLSTSFSGAAGNIEYGGQLASDTDNAIGIINRVGVFTRILSGAEIATVTGDASDWDAAILALSPAQYLKLEEFCSAETSCWVNGTLMDNTVGVPNTQHTPMTRLRYGIVATGGASQTNDLTLYFDRATVSETYIGPKRGLGCTANNEGNYKSYPIFRIFGGYSDVQIQNQNQVKSDGSFATFKLKPSVTIPDGNYYDVDFAANTVVDKYGVNKFNDVAFTSDWLCLEPGDNYLVLVDGHSISTSGNSQIQVRYRDSWL